MEAPSDTSPWTKPPSPPRAALPDLEDSTSLMKEFQDQLVSVAVRRALPQTAMKEIVDMVEKYRRDLPTSDALPSWVTMKRRALKNIPQPRLDVYVRDLTVPTGQDDIVQHCGLLKYPKKKFKNRRRYKPVMVRTYFKIEDIIRVATSLHRPASKHPEFDPTRIVLSFDGVPESKSGSVVTSLDVVSVRFRGCRSIYPIVVLKVTDKLYHKTPEEVLGPIVDEILSLGLQLEFFIADAPARAFIRCQKQHSGNLSCDLCLAYGKKMRKTGLYFPHDGVSCQLRTMPGLQIIMANLDEWITHSNKDRLCGYKGRSPLLRLPDFDIIADISIEYMHLLALGVFKKMFLLSTKSRHNQSYRVPLKKGGEFVAKWVPKQRLPACFPRRARADFAHYKASEWRTLGLQLFSIVIHALGTEELKHLRRAWLLLVFLSRTCLLDEQDLQNVEQTLRVSGSSLEEIGASFLENFKISFGESQISYNVHIVGDHLAMIRRRRPLHEASAFPFESSYGVLLRSFALEPVAWGNKRCLMSSSVQPPGLITVRRQLTFYRVARGPWSPGMTLFKGLTGNSTSWTQLRR